MILVIDLIKMPEMIQREAAQNSYTIVHKILDSFLLLIIV